METAELKKSKEGILEMIGTPEKYFAKISNIPLPEFFSDKYVTKMINSGVAKFKDRIVGFTFLCNLLDGKIIYKTIDQVKQVIIDLSMCDNEKDAEILVHKLDGFDCWYGRNTSIEMHKEKQMDGSHLFRINYTFHSRD